MHTPFRVTPSAVCLAAMLILASGTGGCTWGHRPEALPGMVYELEGHRFQVETVVDGLRVPWALDWLPDGTMIVTERRGRLFTLTPGSETPMPVGGLPQIDTRGEHGLMSVAVSPRFADDQAIFLSYTTWTPKGRRNVIARYRLDRQWLSDEQVLVDDLPAGDYHDGLPLRFGPDGKLYASTGDATQRDLAQDPTSLAGKFLRFNPDGSVPRDNPLADWPVWTIGHRNCQGFDWHPATGALYATEHGPTWPVDGDDGGDELNLIRRGENYGWPTYHHDANGPGCVAPLVQWTPAVAPAGACFYRGDVFPNWRGRLMFVGLRGESLWCVTIGKRTDRVDRISRTLHRQFGRLRAIAEGPDGMLYMTTSNRDARGKPDRKDDRILRIVPAKEEE